MNWYQTDLASIVSTIESGSRPKGGVSTESGEVPSLGGENILQSGGVSLLEVKMVSSAFYERMTKGHLDDGDVLVNKDGAQTGKVGIYRREGTKPSCINEHVFLIRGEEKKLLQEYLFYTLLSQSGQNQIRAQISGSAQPGLKSDFLKGVAADIPESLLEQAQIAEILSTIDKAIEQTEAIIAKQQRIKIGLMQDLLTRGIDEHGNLRSEQTHQFKNSPLGRIPVEWEVKELGSQAYVTKLAGFEFTNYFNYKLGGEIIALRALNIKNEKLDLRNIQRISKEISDILPRSKIYSNDILITYIGAYIGDVLRIVENDKYHLAPNIAKIVSGKSLYPAFLEIYLRFERLQQQIKNLTATTATPSLTMTQIRLLNIVVPCRKEEQKVIVDKITTISQTVNSYETQLEKLKRVKTGLMQNLLTSKVRVTELLKQKSSQTQGSPK